MQILIVVATKQEVEPFLEHFKFELNSVSNFFESKNTPNIYILITGVGMVNTAFALGKISHVQFDVCLNAGIAGAFKRELNLGELVLAQTDEFAEMGAEDGEDFIKYEDLKLGGGSKFSSNYNNEFDSLKNLKKVKGITVNKVHGNENSILKVQQLFSPELESMEGAAFLSSMQNSKSIYLQLRAISNYVERRDKSKWQIPLALKNLNEKLIELIEEIK